MADQLQNILGQINQQFDLSFDNHNEENSREVVENHTTEEMETSDTEIQHRTSTSINVNEGVPIEKERQQGGGQDGGENVEEQMLFRTPDKQEMKGNQSQQIESSRKNSLLEASAETGPTRQVSPDKPLALEADTTEDQQQLMSYQALTQKFQMALSRVKHAHSASTHNFHARQQKFLQKKSSAIDLLRTQQIQYQKVKYSGKPLINSKSQHLIQHHKPIHQRYKEVIEEKQKKINIGVIEKKIKEEEEEEKIIKDIKEKDKQIKEKYKVGGRSGEEYYQSMKNWAEGRDKKVEEIAAREGKKKLEEASFKPQLNPKTENMMKKKGQRVPIYEKEPQPKKIGVDKNCTFKPNLNKTFQK